MPKKLPPIEYLHKVLRYDPDTGFLYWKKRSPDTFPQKGVRSPEHICRNWNARWAGKRAFTQRTTDGYHQGLINGASYRAAPVAWAMCKGYWPQTTGLFVDHINNIRDDDRISNLQLLSASDNARKRLPTAANPSGFVGVSFDKEKGQWRARITLDNKRVSLGRYTTLEEAVKTRLAAEKESGYGKRSRVSVLGHTSDESASEVLRHED